MQLLVPWEEAALPLMISVVRSRMRQVSWHMLAPYGVTPQQFQVLRALEDKPGLCHGELVGALGLDKPTATRILQALQAKGWVEILPHPDHGRKLRLELSLEGRNLLDSLLVFRKTIRDGLEQDFDDEEKRAIRALLLKLKNNLDRMDAEQSTPSQP